MTGTMAPGTPDMPLARARRTPLSCLPGQIGSLRVARGSGRVPFR